jgi:predicted peptidase
LKDFAHSEHAAILAPLFLAGIDSYTDLENYKLLGYKTMRSDLTLLQMLDEVAARWTGIATQRVFMIGFSGGGEFVQRFMYLHSERLLIISIRAPGRATALYGGKKWPDGIQNVDEVFGVETRVDIKMISRVPIQLVVSSADNLVHGGEEF